MIRYEYGRIHTLARNLEKAEIAQELIDQIMEGGEGIRRSTSSEKKAEWMKEAMLRMDNLLDRETRHSVREACACCVGGKRLNIAKGISRANEKLEDRIPAGRPAGPCQLNSQILRSGQISCWQFHSRVFGLIVSQYKE